MIRTLLIFVFAISSLSLSAQIDTTGFFEEETYPTTAAPPFYRAYWGSCRDSVTGYEIPGCSDQKIFEFIKQNMKYPKACADSAITGKVYVGFFIEVDGSITNVKVMRGAHPLLDEEAKRVVSIMPNWVPCYRSGKPIKVEFYLPFNFELATPTTTNDTDNKN